MIRERITGSGIDCVSIRNSHDDFRSSRTACMANVVGQESPVDRDGRDWDVCAADLGVSPARDAAEFGQQRSEVAVGVKARAGVTQW